MRVLNFADGFDTDTQPTTVGQPASDIVVTPAGNLESDNVQDALEEHQGDIDQNTTDIAANAAAIATKQPTGNYMTALTGDVTASGPGSSVATINGLALTKLAATTVSRALVSDGSGFITPSAATATEVSYLSGVTSAIQSQLNALGGGSAPVDMRSNYSIACSVSANALTIALKDGSGSDPSGGSPASFYFRSLTAATGDYTAVSATAATSLVISSGSTLGHASGKLETIYVYAINNSGTVVLGASSSILSEGQLYSSTAEGGAGAADSSNVLYTASAVTTKPLRLIAVLESTQTTAGTWAAAPQLVSLLRTPRYTLGSQQVFSSSGTWTRPSGCRAAKVTVIGAGGGGAGADGQGAGTAGCGGGGAGGGAAIKFITVGLGSSETVTIGAAGTAGAVGDFDGGAGGTTSFGSHCSATGGGGGDGISGSSAAGSGVTNIAAPGVGSNGDINFTGQHGGHGLRSGSAATAYGGAGGNNGLGWPGTAATARSSAAIVTGVAGANPGAGGSGGAVGDISTNVGGGAGAAGLVIVEEYY